MTDCPSGITMAALTTGLVLSDIWNLRSDRVLVHLFLGGIVTALFYAFCGKGYEMINWGVIALFLLVVVVIPIMNIASRGQPTSTASKGCNECGDVPSSSCSCVPPPPPPPPSCSTGAPATSNSNCPTKRRHIYNS
jgi:hypothetical protein